MARQTRHDTRGARPTVRHEGTRTDHRGRPVPPLTGTAPVRPSGVPARRWDVAGPVGTYDETLPGYQHVAVRDLGSDETATAWRSEDRRRDHADHPYGKGRSRTVGASSRARIERRRQAAVSASRLDAVRIAERMRLDAPDTDAWTGRTDRQRSTGRDARATSKRRAAAAAVDAAARDMAPRARKAGDRRRKR